tara:strand:- start:758 stop:871 length:114 start_codon:yes stop_codon:yes gene_type:complete
MYEVDVDENKYTWEGTDFKKRWYYEGYSGFVEEFYDD